MRRLRVLPAISPVGLVRMTALTPMALILIGIVLLTTAVPARALSSPLVTDKGNPMAQGIGPRVAAGSKAALPGQVAGVVVSGAVFFDANGDGVRGVGESGGVEMAEVVLKTPGGAPVGPSFITALDGVYQFGNVAPGTYVVEETDAPGYVSTTPNSQTITVGSTAVSGIDFGDTMPFVITGYIYNDLNGDGTQQVNERGLLGVPVELYNDLNRDGLIDASDPLLASTETDVSGIYALHDVLPGFRVLRILPPVGAKSSSGNQAPLNLVGVQGGVGLNEFWQHFPLIASSEPEPACAFNTSIQSNFNGTAIPTMRTVWFTARLKASGLPTGVETTVYFDNALIQFGAAPTPYHLVPARGKVVFSPSASSTTTVYDAATQTWTTTVSRGNWDKEVFLTGLGFGAPDSGLPGGLEPMTWSGRLSGTKAGITLEWKWSAAVYASLSTDYNANGVKAVSGDKENLYNNGDQAGTPENYKDYLTNGARGGGGANYTGNDTQTVRGLCVTPAVAPYGARVNCGSTSFTDSLWQVWQTDRKYTLGAWGFTGGTEKSAGAPVSGTVDDFLYQRFRERPEEYRFTVPNDTYDVRLKFAEFAAQNAGERVMRITLEGTVVETGLDILARGGKYNVLDTNYVVTVSDGLLNILFDKVSGKEPVVSAIQVMPHPKVPTPTPTPPTPTPTPTDTATPTNTPSPTNTPAPYSQLVNSGGATYTDAGGGVWAGDKAYKTGSWGYTGGGAKSSKVDVKNTTEDALYRAYRENPHEYRFTVRNGTYTVVLKFAEFTATNANDRLMNISIEGTPVASDFSIWAAAGGKSMAVDKTYTPTVNDGVLNISFVKASGSNKEPVISAIKVSGQ